MELRDEEPRPPPPCLTFLHALHSSSTKRSVRLHQRPETHAQRNNNSNEATIKSSHLQSVQQQQQLCSTTQTQMHFSKLPDLCPCFPYTFTFLPCRGPFINENMYCSFKYVGRAINYF